MAIVRLEPINKVLTPEQIVSLLIKRQQLYGDRDALYDLYLRYYYGKQANEGSEAMGIVAMNSQGRPLLREQEGVIGRGINNPRTYDASRLPPIVDDYQAVIGRLPTTRVEPPDASPQGQAKAEKLTKYLASTHELSHMDEQQAQAGHWLSALGDVLYLIEPIGSDKPDSEQRPVWTVVNPRSAYPSFLRGYRRFELADVVVAEVWSPDEIRRAFRYDPGSEDPEKCTVLVYLSAHQRTVLVGIDQRPHRVAHVEWDLGVCPGRWVYNKVTGEMANSDIRSTMVQQDFLNAAFNLMIDGLTRAVYPPLEVRDPIQVSENLEVGPDALIEVTGTGGVKAIQSNVDFKPAMELINQTLADINAGAGTSNVRQEGQMHGSIQTGKAIHATQGPQATRIEMKQTTMGAALQDLNRITLLMQETAPLLKKAKFKIEGSFRGTPFAEDFDASVDIQGWYRNTVVWESLVGMNMQQKLSVAYEGMMAEIGDDLWAREQVGIEDPIGMRQRIEAYQVAKAEREAKVQQVLQSAQGGGGDSPQGQAPGQAAGSQPSGAPPTPISHVVRPSGMPGGAGPAGGLPFGATREAVQQALQAVADRLKGEVHALGDLARNGWSLKPRVAISDHRDKSAVSEAVASLPGVRVFYSALDRLPTEAVRLA